MTTLIELETDLMRAADVVLALNDRLESGEAVPTEEYDAALVPFHEALTLAKHKRDRFAEFVLFLDKQQEFYADLASKNSRRAKAIENLGKRLRAMVEFIIKATDSNVLEGESRRMTLCNNSVETLLIKDESKLPERCWKMVRTVDKDAVRAAVKNGSLDKDVAELVRGEHLRIR